MLQLSFRKLVTIGTTDSATLPGEVKLVSTQKCKSDTRISMRPTKHQVKSRDAENETLRRQLDRDKPKSCKYIHTSMLHRVGL